MGLGVVWIAKAYWDPYPSQEKSDILSNFELC